MVSCVLLLVLAGWVLFGGLGDAAFHDGDEALYAAVAVGMANGGHWLTPHYWDAPLLNKPPLPYWLMALSYKVLPGSIELQSRWPSALAALLLVALVYGFVRSFGGWVAGAAAALLMLSNMQFLYEHGARSACFDAPVVLLSFAALTAGAWSHRSFRARLVSALSLAAVLMIKAPVVVLPAVSVLAYLVLLDRRAAVSWLAWSAASIAVIALPWHVYQLVAHGRDFWDTYVVYEMLGRAGATESLFVSEPFVHLEAAWKSFLPWSPLLTVALAAAAVGWPREATAEGTAMRRLLAGYILLLLIGLCFLRSKWPWYVLPVYPAIVVLGALFVRDVLRTRWRWAVPPALALTAVTRFLIFHLDPAYNPVVRGGHLWPLREDMLALLDRSPGVLAWIAGMAAALVGCTTILPRCRRSVRIPEVVTVSIAALIFAASFHAVASVPTKSENAARRLAADLEASHVDTIFLIGFSHQPRYGYRIEPLAGFYLLQSGARLVDCKDLECIAPDPAIRSALVVDLRAMTPGLEQALKERLEQVGGPNMTAWLVNPESSTGYREF